MNDFSMPNQDHYEQERHLTPVSLDNHGPVWDGATDENMHEAPPATPMGPALAWQAFSQWWYICLPVGVLLATALVAAVWYTFVPMYEVEAWLKIESNKPFMFFTGREVTATADRFERTQVELLRNRVVLERVLERPEIASLQEILEMDLPIETLGRQLQVGSQNESDLFYVRFQSPRAENAKLIVNAVVTQYVKNQEDETVERNRKISDVLQVEVDRRAEELDVLRTKAEKSAIDAGLDPAFAGDEDPSNLPARTAIFGLSRQLADSQAELVVLQATEAAYKEELEQIREGEGPADENGLNDEPKPTSGEVTPTEESKIASDVAELNDEPKPTSGEVKPTEESKITSDVAELNDEPKPTSGEVTPTEESGITSDQTEHMVDLEVEQSVEIQDRQQRLSAMRMLLADTLDASALGESDPSVEKLRKEIEQFEKGTEDLRLELKTTMTKSLRLRMAYQRRDRLATELAQVQMNIKKQIALQKFLNMEIEKQRSSSTAADSQAGSGSQTARLAYSRTRDKLAIAERVYEFLLQRVNEMKTESRAPSRVTVLMPAKVPPAPIERIPLRKMSMATAGGLLLPFLLAFLWEFRAQRVTAGKQISHIRMLPLLAEVPVLPSRVGPVTVVSSHRIENQRARFQDSVHYLCRSILLSEGAQDLQVLAVTSAISGEGKSTLASQLALSFALYCREPVLLIDADLRDPSIHKFFDVPASPGLADLLVSENGAAAKAASTTIQSHLDLIGVLPAGKVDRHPHGVLSAGKLEALLEELRKSFRYIIVDTPPVSSVGEALTVCKAADATLLSTRQDWSRQSQVQMAYQRVLAVGAKPIGVVLNGVSHSRYTRTYGSYGIPSTG